MRPAGNGARSAAVPPTDQRYWERFVDDVGPGPFRRCRIRGGALAAVRQVTDELTVRESMIFLDLREFTSKPLGLHTVQRGPLMLVYLTDVRGERVVIIQVNWIS